MIKDRILDVCIITTLTIGALLVVPKVVYSMLKKDGLLR